MFLLGGGTALLPGTIVRAVVLRLLEMMQSNGQGCASMHPRVEHPIAQKPLSEYGKPMINPAVGIPSTAGRWN